MCRPSLACRGVLRARGEKPGGDRPSFTQERSSAMSVPQPIAESIPREETPGRVSLTERLVTLAVVVVPLLGLAAAVVLLWGFGFRWVDLGLLVGMYLLTGLGITVGFHRLFTHRSFETNRV